MIRSAVKGLKRVKVLKTVFRVAKVCGRALERVVIGAINIGLKYLSSDGSPVVLGSTGARGVWVMLVNPHRGPTPLTELQVDTDTIEYR
jgi:hypothetical protein